MSQSNIPHLESGFSFGGPLSQILTHSPNATVPPSAFVADISKGTPRYWMLEAFKESLKGIGISNPNPAVGCVLVDSHGNEISRGHTHAYRGIHAERHAFQNMGDPNRLVGATAYVTLEPCSHQGNQGPCVELILNSKIQKVVIAKQDPNPLVNGKAIERLKAAGKTVEVGIFSNEVTAWNFPFFATFHLKRPIVVLKWAQTLDGQLADDLGHSKWITGPIARAYTHWLRQRYDLILVGAQTALRDLPQLNVRDCPPPHQSQPIPVVFDPYGKCLTEEGSFHKSLLEKTFHPDRPAIWITFQSIHPKYVKLQDHVVHLTIEGRNPVQELMEKLNGDTVAKALGHPLQSIFVEGGPKTLTSFMNEGFSDLIHLFSAPIFTGGRINRIQTEKELSSSLRFHPLAINFLGPHLTGGRGQDILTELVSNQLLSIF